MAIVRITVVEVLSDGRSIFKCAYCNGNGKEPYPQGQIHEYYYTKKPCSLCGGRGLLVVKHQDHLIQRARCDGLGHEPSGGGSQYYNKKCRTCSGSGALSLTGNVRIVTDPSTS